MILFPLKGESSNTPRGGISYGFRLETPSPGLGSHQQTVNEINKEKLMAALSGDVSFSLASCSSGDYLYLRRSSRHTFAFQLRSGCCLILVESSRVYEQEEEEEEGKQDA